MQMAMPAGKPIQNATPALVASSATAYAPMPKKPACASDNCPARPDRKSTRLNSSHLVISYAVFCLKKKKGHKNRFEEERKRKPQVKPNKSGLTTEGKVDTAGHAEQELQTRDSRANQTTERERREQT